MTVILLTIWPLTVPWTVRAQEEDTKPHIDDGTNKAIREINADILSAREADREERFADAESLMLKDTAAKPQLIPPWVELGLAQIGLKKLSGAEACFKTALAIDPKNPMPEREIGYYQNGTPRTTHVARHRRSAGGGLSAPHAGYRWHHLQQPWRDLYSHPAHSRSSGSY
jgi:hypothetical protein